MTDGTSSDDSQRRRNPSSSDAHPEHDGSTDASSDGHRPPRRYIRVSELLEHLAGADPSDAISVYLGVVHHYDNGDVETSVEQYYWVNDVSIPAEGGVVHIELDLNEPADSREF